MMAFYTIFTLPSGYFASTSNFVSSLFVDVKGLVIIIFSLSLAFWLGSNIIKLVRQAIK